MTLDRAEVSLALYPTLLTAYAHDPETAARRAVQHADQLLLALTPPVAGPCPGEDARDDAEARKRIAGRPPIVCLCGSTRFIDTFQSEYGRLTDEGNIVLSVGRVVPQSEQALGSERKVALDALHLRKIDLCDRVLVLNVGGYVGPSTRREIEYAKAHSKPVDLLYPDAGLDGQPPVAPKSEAAKYEPRVGDVVRYDDTNAGDEMIVSRIEGGITYWRYLRVRGGADISSFQPSALRFIRPATPAERAAAGLPSPEATRPTHVRITKSASPSRFKDGDVLRVVGWLGDTPSVDIDCHMGGPYVLYDSKWEPADAPKAPAPVEPAKGEAGELTTAPKWVNDAANAIMREVKAVADPDDDLDDPEDYASLRGAIEGIIMRAAPTVRS